MRVNYNINIEKNLSHILWKLLTENFNCIIDRIQHSENGEELNYKIIILNNIR